MQHTTSMINHYPSSPTIVDNLSPVTTKRERSPSFPTSPPSKRARRSSPPSEVIDLTGDDDDDDDSLDLEERRRCMEEHNTYIQFLEKVRTTYPSRSDDDWVY